MRMSVQVIRIMVAMFILGACASYHHTHRDFNQDFESGNLRKALDKLQGNNQLNNNRNKFLYYVNNGLVLSILGKYQESNAYLEKAYLFGEDHCINYIQEAASYWTNPMVTVYRGEDHEHLMVLYYKAINYMKMEKYEDALVECRRLNVRLQQLSDKYSSERKYRRDAFIHTLMGIIYQASRDYNNAFIAYRNALEVYEDDYGRLFGISAPDQLKADLLNMAYYSGFQDDFLFYKEKFNRLDYQPDNPDAELVFFWHNGLSPVKSEWSIDFVIQSRPDNWVVFTNDDLGISFPFQLDDEKDRSSLSRLEVFRVAFPRYVERPVYYQHAVIWSDDAEYPLEIAEDLNRIAVHSLRERMMLEFNKGLLRAGLKKATEHTLRKEDQALGAVIGIMNAITEQADIRNWQTLPYSISYTRVPVKEGEQDIEFTMFDQGGRGTPHNFTYQIRKDQTLFHTFSSLESSGLSGRYY